MMNSKTWLTAFGIVALIVIGAAGWYCYSNFGRYRVALASWDSKVSSIQRLERKVPYPNKENAEAIEKKLEEYKGSVDSLFESLDKFQKPLNTTLTNTEFQQRVSEKVREFRPYAEENDFELNTESEFRLGFDAYQTTLPTPELVPILDYELESIDKLVRVLVDAGAESLSLFQRDPVPGEPGAIEQGDSGVVHKYPVRMRFRCDHDALQEFINQVSNDRENFYIIRVLKVENDAKTGPFKGASQAGGSDIPRFVNPDTREIADLITMEEWGFGDASPEEVEAAAKEDGFELATEDLVILMGQEKLTVFMVVDIVRFLKVGGGGTEAEEEAGGDEEDEEK